MTDARVSDTFPRLCGTAKIALLPAGGPVADAPGSSRPLNVGVVLSGGQAPGGAIDSFASCLCIYSCMPLSHDL